MDKARREEQLGEVNQNTMGLKNKGILPLILVGLFLGSLIWPPALGEAGQDGVIRGSLANRTPGGASVDGQEVSLKTFLGGQERGQASTRSDGQGRFEFTGLVTDSNYSYGLAVAYQGAEYKLGPRSFDPGASLLTWEVSVYDATPKPDQIKVVRGHLVISARDDVMTVLQFFSFQNTGDKTFVGSRAITPDGRKETIRLSLPTAADQVAAEEGLEECCAFRTEDGLSDTLALPPGGRDVVLSYLLPYKSSTVFLDLPLYYPVDALNLLVAAGGAKVSSPQLTRQDPVDMGGQKYQHYAGSNLPVHTELSIDLAGLPQKGLLAGRLDTNSLRWGGAGLAALAMGLALFYGMRRRPALRASPAPARRPPAPRAALLSELAELDDRFAAGQIGVEEYERQRAQKQQRLIEATTGQEGQA